MGCLVCYYVFLWGILRTKDNKNDKLEEKMALVRDEVNMSVNVQRVDADSNWRW
jgi:hypothetical protein